MLNISNVEEQLDETCYRSIGKARRATEGKVTYLEIRNGRKLFPVGLERPQLGGSRAQEHNGGWHCWGPLL